MEPPPWRVRRVGENRHRLTLTLTLAVRRCRGLRCHRVSGVGCLMPGWHCPPSASGGVAASAPSTGTRRDRAGQGGPGRVQAWPGRRQGESVEWSGVEKWKKGENRKSEKRKKVKNGSGHPGIELRTPDRTSRHRIRAPLSVVPKAAPLTGLARFSTHYRLRLAPLGAQLSPHQVRREGTRRPESGR